MWNLNSVEWAPTSPIAQELHAGCNIARKSVRTQQASLVVVFRHNNNAASVRRGRVLNKRLLCQLMNSDRSQVTGTITLILLQQFFSLLERARRHVLAD